tara:strand:+ start:797 stop:1012 length:216 start_codon:yes stop_codon:yes gene_type:complete
MLVLTVQQPEQIMFITSLTIAAYVTLVPFVPVLQGRQISGPTVRTTRAVYLEREVTYTDFLVDLPGDLHHL